MKQRLATVLVVCGLALLGRGVQGAASGCKVERSSYRGWNTFKLSNGLVTLHVAPDIGGRVIQFELADHPFFYVNGDLAGKVYPPEENGGEKGGWKNYGGSKLWPAPQGWERDDQWPGPPDPVLDGGRYRGEITREEPGHVAVTVDSPADERTGIQFTRTLNLYAGGTQVRVDCGMRNISRRPVRWSIWEVTQLDTADPAAPGRFNDDYWAFCPLNPRSVHPKGFDPMFGQANHPSFRADQASGLLTVKYDHRVGKVGLDSSAGWLAAVNNRSGHGFVGKFTHFPQQPYPDHASVEFWLNGAGEFIINGLAITNSPDPKETPYLMEAEILSPLAELQPAQVYRFRIEWFATRCSAPVREVTSAGVVCAPVALRRTDGQPALEGRFGVFYRGRAEAVFRAADGKVTARVDLGPIDPNQMFSLSKEVSVPPDAFRVSIRVLDEAGQDRGVLGNALIAGK